MVPAQGVIELARSYKDTPFHHQGRQPGVGLDCVGLLACAFQAAGVPIRDRTNYPRQPIPADMLDALREHTERVPKRASWLPADVLWMHFDEPQHLALYTGRSVIHAYAQVGRVVEHRMDATWMGRVVSVWRHPGVSHE
ncbi:C40 family peptidase [Ectothiorhodospiraceae bacterium WFHF3C12]|nr:C40 family peptidase [Ectothiorhodospiraceae bacterium WFHF3C12]